MCELVMSKYKADFWEISVEPEILESVLVAPDMLETLLSDSEEDQTDVEKAQLKQDAIEQIHDLIQSRLTSKQQEIVQMYFYEDKTQEEIAHELGISQQVVSKQLFGVLREGRRVGGAMQKLRKICEKLEIDPQKWV